MVRASITTCAVIIDRIDPRLARRESPLARLTRHPQAAVSTFQLAVNRLDRCGHLQIGKPLASCPPCQAWQPLTLTPSAAHIAGSG
jgi:hypothetical protein